MLESNKKQIVGEMVVESSPSASQTTSTAEQKPYYQSNFDDNYSDVQVRRAFLWIKVDEVIIKSNKTKVGVNGRNSTKSHKAKSNGRRNPSRNFFRLWVFRIVESSSVSIEIFKFSLKKCAFHVNRKKLNKLWCCKILFFFYSTKNSDQQLKLSASKSVHVSRLGWQKLDITSTVRQWYASGGKMRMRFLVDCSGCAKRIKIHLFDSKSTKNSKTRAKPNLLQNGKEKMENLD